MDLLKSVVLALGAALALLVPAAAPAAQSESSGQLNRAIQAYNDGNYEASAHGFFDLVENAGGEVKLKADYYLAQSFFRKKLLQSAVYYYGGIIKAGPRHPYYLKATEGLVNVAEELGDDLIIPSLLNKHYDDEFAKLPADVLNKVNFIVGQVSYRSNKLEESQSFLSTVPVESSYYARSRYLAGIISARNGKPEQAIGDFEDVIRLKSRGKVTYADLKEIQELATLGLARTYYGTGDYAKSVKYYEAVPRFSAFWDQALFENGWARFQNDDWGGSLGSLQALHAPQFEGSFQPESWVLKATVYYYACLYDDAKMALKGFEDIYLPMNEKLKPLLQAGKDEESYFKLATDPSDSRLPKAVRNYILANRRLTGFRNFISQLDREKEAVRSVSTWRGSRLGQELVQVIDGQRAQLTQAAGKFIRLRLDDVSKIISGFEGQSEIIKFEVSKAEKDLLEKGNDMGALLARKNLYRPEVPEEQWDYWKFQGEFWLDEIGYYQYTLKKGCDHERQE